jgi:hypothetical protein
MQKCITVLTRGYHDFASYDKLIKRNQCISNCLLDKTTDILIFHEGNITNEQQEYIKEKTPELLISFINVNNGMAFRPEKENIQPQYYDIHTMRIGYRHMCHFWFVDFWDFVSDYELLIRIDEDCFIDDDIDFMFELLERYSFLCGRYANDCTHVTVGLNEFTLEFLKRHRNIDAKERYPCGPYTNVFAINLNIKHNDIFQRYITEIDLSQEIYIHRWGDLPLWGEVIEYIFGPESAYISYIKYYHESHDMEINFD